MNWFGSSRSSSVCIASRITTSQQRYQAGAGTLVELTQARAGQVQAASAVVSARYGLVFQQAIMSYYTGELDPTRITLGA
jgi:outer membrane protein